jgi:signal transduction histidine kinase
MFVWWGRELINIYNDAYAPMLGQRHPDALGMSARQIWQDVWPEVGPQTELVLNKGQSTWNDRLLLVMERNGYTEETYFTFSYSPVPDDDGAAGGVFCAVTEETERVIGERRTQVLRQLAARTAEATTADEACAISAAVIADSSYDLPFGLIYLLDGDGCARLAAATGLPAGSVDAPVHVRTDGSDGDSPWILNAVPATAGVVQDVRTRNIIAGPWPEPVQTAMVVPLGYGRQSDLLGFLVAGASPRRAFDDSYRGFMDLVAGSIASAIINAERYAEERKRSATLAMLDRAKTLFFSNVSHEFRTPLTLMLGPVEEELARPDGALPPDTVSSLQIVRRNALRLQSLVNSLLDFSRIEAGRAQATYEPTDLAAFTADLAASFRSALERAGLDLRIDCSPLSQPVFVDREMWEKIVLNLLSNAFKYTFDGSITVTAAERDGRVYVSVQDTGTGIPEHELPHLFDRFHRVEGARGRTQEGSGIGLALVHELVKINGGQVSVSSTVGEGSTFTICLPFGSAHLPQEHIRSEAELASTATPSQLFVAELMRRLPELGSLEPGTTPTYESAVGPATGGGFSGRVLVVDDNADMRDYLHRLLSAEYEVIFASDGRKALAEAVAHPPDLVLSDIMMPDVDGFGLLEALRSDPRTRSVPLVFLSARAGDEASVTGMAAGADDYLVKPFAARELLARVKAHIALRRERQRAHELLIRVFSQAPVAICLLRGPDLVFELANETYKQLLRGMDVTGLRLADVMPELDEGTWEVLQRVLQTGEAFVAREFRTSYDKDGDGVPEDHWFDLIYHPLTEPDGSVSGIIAVGHEVTVQVLARQQLEHVNKELQEFTFVASHDLQEPLRMVNAYTQLLLRRHVPEDDAEAQLCAGVIYKGVYRMERLIRDLLSYSRAIHADIVDARPTDLNLVLTETLSLLESRIKEAGAVITSDLLPTVLADDLPLTHVFQNLLGNSLKYRVPAKVPRIHIAARPADGEWILSIRDNGIGFAPEYTERIFGLFKRLHNDAEYSGTGLGLAICRRIIERYGGRIWAEGTPGEGACFYFTVPTADPRSK